MKSVISILLMFVALSSCQNVRSYEQRIQDYAQTARAIPYAPPQSRAQNYVPPPTTTTTTTTPEPLRTAPPPTRQYYPAQYGQQQMRVAAVTPTPETIRISFSGLDSSNASPAHSRMEAPVQVKSQYGQERRTSEAEEMTGAEGQNGNVPMPTSVRVAPRQSFIPILRFDQEIQEGVKNRFHFTAANGIEEEEETLIEHLPPGQRSHESKNYEYPASNNNYGYDYDTYDNYEDVEIVKRGKYSYISPEGEHVEVSWIADKDGFRPVGSHIPTVAPVPAVRESLPIRQEVPMTRQYPASHH